MADGSVPAVANRVAPPVVVSFEEKERMAQVFARSGLFGAKTPEQALALILIAEAEGIHPSQAIQEYDIIEGKPARKAERQLARFQLSGGKVKWLAMTEREVRAEFSHPQGSDVLIGWTIEQAEQVKYYAKGDGGGVWKPLTNKLNWRNFPRAMLRARVIAEGVRACFPGYALVTLTTEEAEDLGVLTSEPVDDAAPAQPAIAADTAPIRGKAKKDLWAKIAGELEAAEDEEEVAQVWDGYAQDRARFSKSDHEHLEEMRERALERVGYAAYVAEADPVLAALNDKKPPEPESAFEDLKAQGLAALERADAAESKALFAAWEVELRAPNALAACTDAERKELQSLYRNIKGQLFTASEAK